MSYKNTTSAVFNSFICYRSALGKNPNSQFLHSCSKIRGLVKKFRLFVSSSHEACHGPATCSTCNSKISPFSSPKLNVLFITFSSKIV